MAWGLWNKFKNGVKKVGPLLKRHALPILRKIGGMAYNYAKENQDKIQQMKPFKGIDVGKVFDTADKFIHPIFK